ncbi:hypothetical protein [Amycolatopsis suaedae]|uniref:Uncharacterized protein n=1 Tax=Amycolatopsis suaedae TaxID=2510978 RepID=A0A4Q7J1X9_9PSEU|nr:hypothetical protein [Amycolatopsis suaedae]RZQ60403.1 hypothetical protein EWH70_29320 [Amycolatopsis suaedae]
MPDYDALSALAVQENGLATVSVARTDGSVHASVVNAGPIPDPVSGVPSIGFVAATGSHDDWAEYDRVMAAERRVAVFVAATRITGAG